MCDNILHGESFILAGTISLVVATRKPVEKLPAAGLYKLQAVEMLSVRWGGGGLR